MSSRNRRPFVFVPDQEILLFGGCSQYGCLVLQIRWSLSLHGNQFMSNSVGDKKGGNVSLRSRITPQLEGLFDTSQTLCRDQNIFWICFHQNQFKSGLQIFCLPILAVRGIKQTLSVSAACYSITGCSTLLEAAANTVATLAPPKTSLHSCIEENWLQI